MRRDKAIQYFKLAKYHADLFSKDPHKKVGALFLAPESLQILSLGYNGMPRQVDENIPQRWERPMKFKFVEHAERNAIYNACRSGVCLEDAIAIVTWFPCTDCARAIIQSGVKTLVTVYPDFNHHRWGGDFQVSMEMLQEVGMSLIFLEPNELV